MTDDDEPMTAREKNLRARLAHRATRDATAEAPAHECVGDARTWCYGCRVRASVAAHAAAVRYAPRPKAKHEFSGHNPFDHVKENRP